MKTRDNHTTQSSRSTAAHALCVAVVLLCAGAFFTSSADAQGTTQTVQTTQVAQTAVPAVTKNAQAELIQQRINDRNQIIDNLEKEIAAFQAQIEEVSKESDTLENAVKSLEISRKKLETQLQVTQARINDVNQTITKLGGQIGDAAEQIAYDQRIIAETLKKINTAENQSLIEILFTYSSISQFFDSIDSLERLQGGVHTAIDNLLVAKKNLESNKKQTESKRAELLTLKADLSGQTSALEATKKEKDQLLSQTKNLESNYKKILADKVNQKAQFEKEIFDLESSLKVVVNAGDIPKSGTGVLAWPLDKVHVTQYFGNTPFATKNPQGYSGKGHNGIDLRASIGTRVKTAETGIVLGVGDTGLVRGCYSYGRWILVKHTNGLSTLYAHLSVQSVKEGDTVVRGDTIGYSGNTGYSTGPHLHFGVYATEGIQLTRLASSNKCKGAYIPISAPGAYLNPLSYL